MTGDHSGTPTSFLPRSSAVKANFELVHARHKKFLTAHVALDATAG